MVLLKQINNVLEELDGTPLPHHLRGEAEITYDQEKNLYLFKGSAVFSSEHPSIASRTELYLPNPHVNLAEFFYASWNAAHLVANQVGEFDVRTLLSGRVDWQPKKPIPPDATLDLLLEFENPSRIKTYEAGVLRSVLVQEGSDLAMLESRYVLK